MKRTEVTTEDEERIITSMIVNVDFCKRILTITEPDHFKLYYAKTLFRWIKEYYEETKKNPNTRIRDIFNVKKRELDEEDSDLIHEFLNKLDDKYLIAVEVEGKTIEQYNEVLNDEYFYKKAVDYILQQSLVNLANDVKSHAVEGKLDQALEILANYKKVARQTSKAVNPHDPVVIDRFLNRKDKDKILKMPGALGDLFGWWKRGYLVLGQGVFGSGKSTFLQEVCIKAMSDRLKVVLFTLEMSEVQYMDRYSRRRTGKSTTEEVFVFPAFDCLLNQTGECNRPERTCHSKIRTSRVGNQVKFEDAPSDYKICTECREKNPKNFIVSTWFFEQNRPTMDEWDIYHSMEKVTRNYGDCYRIYYLGSKDVNVADIKNELDTLEYTENFIPDVIVVDYADLLKGESKRYDTNDLKLVDSFDALSNLAKERRSIVVTVSQVKTEVLKKDKSGHGKMGDASGSSQGKYGPTDFVFAFMQTGEEKERGVARFNVVKSRDESMNEMTEVYVLQQLRVANALVDSHLKPY
jgi:replicative DNA helicase